MMRSFSLLLLLVWVAGCSSTGSNTDGSSSTSTSNAGKGPTPKTAADIPESLKTDAYHYYGLSNSNPVKMQLTVPGAKGPQPGEQTIAFKELKDDAAVFLTTRSGSLEGLGTEEVSLEKDGIYILSSTVGDIGGKSLEMPSDLKPGTTWSKPSEVKRNDGSVSKYDATFKVIGTEKVKTKAGDYDALLITSDGPAEVNGQKLRMKSKNWYAKDVGVVKVEIETAPTKGSPQRIVIEATQ